MKLHPSHTFFNTALLMLYSPVFFISKDGPRKSPRTIGTEPTYEKPQLNRLGNADGVFLVKKEWEGRGGGMPSWRPNATYSLCSKAKP